jgi:hypothetical protein
MAMGPSLNGNYPELIPFMGALIAFFLFISRRFMYKKHTLNFHSSKLVDLVTNVTFGGSNSHTIGWSKSISVGNSKGL